MPRYRYTPANRLTRIPALGITAPGVYELDPADVARYAGLVEGVGGGSCLVPEYDVPQAVVDAVNDFVTSVCEPTPHNPETAPISIPEQPPKTRKRRSS